MESRGGGEAQDELAGLGAREALSAVQEMHAAADRRAQAPRWYYFSLALVLFVLVAGQALADPVRIVLTVAALFAEGLLVGIYQSVTGISATRRKLSRRLLPRIVLTVAGLLAVVAAATYAARTTGSGWWFVAGGVVVAGLMLAASYRYWSGRLTVGAAP